jgi:hypothetical protein
MPATYGRACGCVPVCLYLHDGSHLYACAVRVDAAARARARGRTPRGAARSEPASFSRTSRVVGSVFKPLAGRAATVPACWRDI